MAHKHKFSIVGLEGRFCDSLLFKTELLSFSAASHKPFFLHWAMIALICLTIVGLMYILQIPLSVDFFDLILENEQSMSCNASCDVW